MKNTFKWSFHLLRLFAIGAFVSTVMLGRAADTRTNKSPGAASGTFSQWDLGAGFDPTTGLPKAPEKREQILPSLQYNGVPISEVAKNLKEVFNGEFDVLLPFGQGSGHSDWQDVSIDLQLKNVTASEVFNAMNLVFEATHRPLHWDLVMNGARRTAVLRILDGQTNRIDPATGLPVVVPSGAPESPTVFFIGDLLGSPLTGGFTGGMSMDQVVETVTALCKSAGVSASISGHKQAQLIIVRGTEDDRNFVRDALAALREKVRLDAERQAKAKATGPDGKTNGTTTH